MIYYLITLIDKHDEDILRKDKDRYYSTLFKEEIMIMVYHQMAYYLVGFV